MILRCQLVSLLKGVIIFFLKCRTHRKIGKCITVALENPGTMDPAGFRRRLPAMIWERCIGLDAVDFDDALPDRDRERDVYLREQALAPQCDQSHFHVNESGPRG
jgi:hypothetical protein